jgi:hypothetical protein
MPPEKPAEMVFLYPGADLSQSADFDEPYIDQWAVDLGNETFQLWKSIKLAAQREAGN